MFHEELTRKIIGAAIEVHKQLGPGLLESVYQACLARELDLTGLHFEQQKDLPVEYKGVRLESGLRLDFIVETRLSSKSNPSTPSIQFTKPNCSLI